MNSAKRLLIIAISILLLSYICIWVGERGRKKYSQQETEKLAETLENSTYHDILFLGSSRIQNHIHPRIIDSLLHVNSYNLGVEKAQIDEFAVLLEAYLENHQTNPPKQVLLGVDYYVFKALKEETLKYPAQYLPYLDNKVMTDAFTADGYYPLLFKIFPFLLFTEYDDGRKMASVQGLLGRKFYDVGMYKGAHVYDAKFVPVDVLDDKVQNKVKPKFQLAGKGKKSLLKIMEICQQKNIQLMFVYTPFFQNYIDKKFDNEGVIRALDSIAQSNKIPFLRHDTLAMNQEEKYFRDFTHMNRKGAIIYSQRVATDLMKLRNP
jgi:hypothetical protein